AARLALLASSVIALAIIAPTSALADSGGLDTTFTPVTLPANTTFTKTLKLADGSTVAVGSSGTSTKLALVAKFTPAGALDASFGTGGVVTFNAGGGSNDTAYGVSVRAAGGLIISGGTNPTAGSYEAFITTTSATGVLDATWGTGGILTLSSANATDDVYGAHEMAGGDVTFAGLDRQGVKYTVGRVDTTGALVPTPGFGIIGADNAFATDPSDPDATASAAVGGYFERTDSTFALIGYGATTTGTTYFSVTTYPDDGPIATVHTQVPTGATIASITPLSTNGFLAAGAVAGHGAIWRFLPSGTLDTTFGTAGRLDLAPATEPWTATSIAASPDGKYFVVGNVGATRIRTQRLTAAFAPDTTFGDQGGYADRSFNAGGTRAVSVQPDASNRPVIFGALGASAAEFRVELLDYAAPKLGDITYSPSFVQRLNTVTWKFPVTNTGPDASDIVVDVDVPTSVEGQATSVTAGAAAVVADGSGATWTIPQLAAGATATLTLVGKPGEVGNLTVRSSVTGQSAVQVGGTPVAKASTVMVYGAATPRDDVITGTPQRDVIDALTGNDKVYALAGNDTILGNDGNDFLDLGAGNDVGGGGNGTDTIFGQAGSDSISGGAGNDKLRGDAGNDKVSGDDGNDVLVGGVGNDRLFGGLGVDFLDGGKGDDYVHGGPGVDKLYGSTGSDYLIGLTGNDALVGGPGSDRLDGDGGNDYLKGNTGNDFLNGKTGNDRIYGDTGNDWLRGFTGNDFLVGGTGDDLVNGGTGVDHLFGGAGNDVIRADDGAGVDHVDCGNGWDLVYANPGDTVTADCEFVKYDVFAVAAP
ncbi:MAG: calcium-binding protein, partial [Thermoleophilia bacterium]|nr:calcium-binding protein [Thermoleophilia bacterium]